MYRGAILEALAALESFVRATVFPTLGRRFTQELSKWFEEKTMMDFDSRISVLAPLATGISVQKNSTLWMVNKQTRELRKGVVHNSRKVTRREVETVIKNTADWMAYLGRTIELENALLDLKHWVENEPSLFIDSGREAEQIVAKFFNRSKAANVTMNKVFVLEGRRYEADAILEFGSQKVLVESKFVPNRNNLINRLQEAVFQVDKLRSISKIPQACVVLFAAWEAGEIPSGVEKHAGREIYSIGCARRWVEYRIYPPIRSVLPNIW